MSNDSPSSPRLPTISARARRSLQWHYFRRYALWFLMGGLALVATNALGLAIPTRIGEAVQAISDGAKDPALLESSTQVAITAGKWIIVLAIGAALARVASRICIFNAGRFIEFDIRNTIYAKLARLDASFYQALPTGDITSRVTNDVSYIRLLYAISFLHLINTSLAYVIAIQKMVAIDWELTLLSLAPFPFLVISLRYIVRALFDQTKLVQSELAELSNKVQENLSGMTVVKTFNLEPLETAHFSDMSKTYYGHGIKLAIIRNAMGVITGLTAGLATLIVLWRGALRVDAGSLELGAFVEFNSYVVALAFPTMALGWVFSVWNRGQAAFERVMEVLDAPSALAEPEHPTPLPTHSEREALGKIVFEDVSFRYDPEDEPLLDDISFTIEPGMRVAIVGKTGSGKSTLVKLIARTYDPDTGKILIDDVDLRHVALRALRSEVGYVPQDPFLFSMTIAQNMRFGYDALRQDPTLHKSPPSHSLLHPEQPVEDVGLLLDEAVQIAGLSQDIEMFPQGLDTMVGERGITLSGGQKQRVTIARALLVSPRILILDDALSSVDTQTEATILDHLDDLMRDRTSILVTHRYNALSRMDLVLVLEQGRIVEHGTHQDLLARGGTYAQMVSRQHLRERLEVEDGPRDEEAAQ